MKYLRGPSRFLAESSQHILPSASLAVESAVRAMDAMVLQLARDGAHMSMLRRILDTHQSALYAHDSSGNTPLHIAAAAGAGDIVSELLQRDMSGQLKLELNDAGKAAWQVAIGSACAVLQCSPAAAEVSLLSAESRPTLADCEEEEVLALATLPDDAVLSVLRMLDRLGDVLSTREASHRLRCEHQRFAHCPRCAPFTSALRRSRARQASWIKSPFGNGCAGCTTSACAARTSPGHGSRSTRSTTSCERAAMRLSSPGSTRGSRARRWRVRG